MIYIDKITKKGDLDCGDSVSTYGNWGAQQNYKSFEVFFYFLKETRPKRILEIGTSIGGFTSFINHSCKELGIECDILSLDINEFEWYEDMRKDGIDIRVENVFSEGYQTVSDYIIDFIQSEGTTIVLCDGGDKKSEFNLISN
jgi:cephalosporin hydroxylase